MAPQPGTSLACPPVEPVALLRELSHRLRTPLATIHGYASLLEAHADEALDPAKLAGWAGRIQGEIDRATQLLADLSRLRIVLSAGIRPGPLDLRAIALDAVAELAHDLERSLLLEHGPPVPYVGDPLLLRRAVYHLGALALQCGPDVTLRLAAQPPEARVEVAWAAGTADAPAHDPWLLFCRVVARAHAGDLLARPQRLTLLLAAVDGPGL